MNQRLHLFLNFGDDTMPYPTTSLDLDDEQRLARLDQQIDLTALRPLRRLLPIRRGGKDKRTENSRLISNLSIRRRKKQE